MPEAKFTTKEKNKILKEVLIKTGQFYEEEMRKKESLEVEAALDDEIKTNI